MYNCTPDHRSLVKKLDTQPRSHLGTGWILLPTRDVLQHIPSNMVLRPLQALWPRLLQEMANRWCHRSVSTVLTIEVYDLTCLTDMEIIKQWNMMFITGRWWPPSATATSSTSRPFWTLKRWRKSRNRYCTLTSSHWTLGFILLVEKVPFVKEIH